MVFLIGLLTFLTFVAVVLGMELRREARERQMIALIEGGEAEREAGGLTRLADAAVQKLAQRVPSFAGADMVEMKLRQAGKPFGWEAHDVTVWRIVGGIGLLALSFAADTSANGHVFVGLLFAAVGLMVPDLLINSHRSIRQGGIRRQTRSFTMMLTLLATTGIAFEQALLQATHTTTGAFREVLEQMHKRIEFRSTIPEAFNWLADETGVKELERMAVVIEQAKENGTSFADSLKAMIREHDEELENRIERLTQSVNLKVTLTVLFLIVGPTILFDAIIAGLNFLESFEAF